VNEGHLDVHLGELRLPVGAEIFVPEAADNLIVAVEARDHEELLEKLGRLGEGVELTRVDTAGDQVVPRPLGSAPSEKGGLHLQKIHVVQVLADYLGRPVTQQEVPKKDRPAEVEIPVTQAEALAGVGAILGKERRGKGGV